MVTRKLGIFALGTLLVSLTGVADAKDRSRHHSAHAAGSGGSGMASVYGSRRDGYAGARTASGERVHSGGLTAAHKTLPFGTKVRVTHLGNGKSVDVKINDRGPYIAGRIIDLSKAAAGVIGMQGQGIAKVKVTVLGRS